MSATAKDETFEITDKNFRKVAENLEKVKIFDFNIFVRR